MKNISYKTTGTCSRRIDITIDDDNKIAACSFEGGCNGNLQGISKLIVGLDADYAMKTLRGIKCGTKQTSCPDQLARAIEKNT